MKKLRFILIFILLFLTTVLTSCTIVPHKFSWTINYVTKDITYVNGNTLKTEIGHGFFYWNINGIYSEMTYIDFDEDSSLIFKPLDQNELKGTYKCKNNGIENTTIFITLENGDKIEALGAGGYSNDSLTFDYKGVNYEFVSHENDVDGEYVDQELYNEQVKYFGEEVRGWEEDYRPRNIKKANVIITEDCIKLVSDSEEFDLLAENIGVNTVEINADNEVIILDSIEEGECYYHDDYFPGSFENDRILTLFYLEPIPQTNEPDCNTGHSWDEGELTQVPGGGEVMLYTCLVCGERKTEDINNDIGYACDVTITGEMDSLIENVSGVYTAGTTLEIYSHPLMDVDLAMYVNGEFHQIQDTIKIDGEYRWRYSLVLPFEDIVIEFKTVGIEYSDVQTILNIPNLTLEDIVEVRYEHGYIGVAPGRITSIAYSTDMEDRSSVLSILEMTVYEDLSNNWQVCGGGYTLYTIFTNDKRYDIEITNDYISINQKHYKYLGEYISFEYPNSQAHLFITYLDSYEAYTLDDVKIGDFTGLSEYEFIEYPYDTIPENEDAGYIETEFGRLYIHSGNIFYIKDNNTFTYYLIVGEKNFNDIFVS